MPTSYPDWQKITTWFGAPLVADQVVWAGPDVVFGPFDVPSWRALSVFANPGASPLSVGVQWASPNAVPAGIRQQKVFFQPSRTHFAVIPSMSGKITEVRLQAPAAGQTVQVAVIPCNIDPYTPLSVVGGQLARIRNRALGVGLTLADLIVPYSGKAGFYFAASAYPCSVLINGADHLGLEQTINFENVAVAAAFNTELYLGNLINSLTVTNLSGVAITYTAGLTANLSP